jgi:hypothetical protein
LAVSEPTGSADLGTRADPWAIVATAMKSALG